MRFVKIFKGLENDVSSLEAEVNAWIRQSGAKVVFVTGNIAAQSVDPGSKSGGLTQSPFPPSDVILVVLYEAPGK